jgi:Fe-Mn family superoxide dismutase
MYEPREFDLRDVEGLSARTWNLHLELYRGYVENVNRLLTQVRDLASARSEDKALYDARARRLAFEWNGMMLHELFFEALRGPGGTLNETGVLAEALDESFGGFEAWRRDVSEMAALRGIGWVATVRDPLTNRLCNVWIDEHDRGVPAATQAVLVIDLWEHAYLLDYQPAQRGAYVETVLKNVDWSVIEARCKVSDQ